MEFLTLKHSMPAGDLLSLLPGLRHMYEQTGRKWIIYQRIDLQYGDMYEAYPGATYSIRDKAGFPVTMNKAVFAGLHPLLLAQAFIYDFREWHGEAVLYDADILRQYDTTMPYGCINRWPFYLWPEMACDLSKEWIKSGSFDVYSSSILINRTERYNNMLISYNFLKNYESVKFIGLEHEYIKFCKQHDLENVDYLKLGDFFEIAIALKSCKLFIGSQSAIFQIAEGLKINRILECCKPMPNVIGNGEGFYDFISQTALEYYVNKLYNE